MILSNGVVDMSGGDAFPDFDNLGQISGESIISKIDIEDVNDLENNPYFELVVIDKDDKENAYQLQMAETEVTKKLINKLELI